MQKEDVLNKKEMCKKENECANLKSVVATLSTFSVFIKKRRGPPNLWLAEKNVSG